MLSMAKQNTKIRNVKQKQETQPIYSHFCDDQIHPKGHPAIWALEAPKVCPVLSSTRSKAPEIKIVVNAAAVDLDILKPSV